MDAAQTQGTVMKALLFSLILVYLSSASSAPADQRDYFLPQPTVHNYAVILGGAAAEKKYGDQIRHWAMQLHDILSVEYGYRPEQLILLMDQVEPDDLRISGPCRREVIQDKIQALRKVLQPGDRIFFFLLGHGTADEKEAKFVILGPDITGEDFAAILETLSEQDVVVVNTTSASFPFSHALSGPGRVIISATRSRAEKYNTIFAEYFIAALDKHTGDRDKNRRVSMWEAFLFAGRQVEKWYTDQSRIPTEHAVLDDNGDGFFSAEPDPAKDDGRLAQIAYLDLLPAERTLEFPPGVDVLLVNNLTAKIRELERSVFLLRSRKAELPKAAYQEQMETLLIEIARTSRKLRRVQPVPDEPSMSAPHDS
jgi:hypothetical protein